MKSNLFLFTGFGFLGLNLGRYFKAKKYKVSIIGKKVKFPYKTKFTSKKIRLIHKNIFNSRLMNNHDLNNSTVVLTTLNSKKKNFLEKFKNLTTTISNKKPKKIIFISSVGVYGNSRLGKINILDQYSKNCYEAEKICKKKFANLTILRVGNIFGILRPKPGTIEKILMQYLEIKKFKFYKYETIRSYISIDEFCNIIEKTINLCDSGNTYNVTNNKFILSTKNILKFFYNHYGRKIILSRNKLSPTIKISYIKNNKLMKKIKYNKTNNFDMEISKLENFYKKYFIKKQTYFI